MSNTKLLAKNTAIMYSQTIISMFVSIYISRLLLNSLGIEDYGLYNVVGGIVAFITIITSGMSVATQRFLSYELGLNNKERIEKIFSSCVTIHIVLGVIFIIFAESLGFWFVQNKIEIPEGREIAAQYVYHFSVISVSINILSVPFSSLIMSYEKMALYASVGIFDSILKLLICFTITLISKDRLVFYGFLMMLISLSDFIIYLIYCLVNYPESRYRFIWDKSNFLRIFKFASWTIMGQGGMLAANQGTNILVNLFHGVQANAAMGIANQVNAAITGLTNNFFVAYQPQITKSYSSANYSYLFNLIISASKYSFLIIFAIALPIVLNLDFILKLWLGVVPDDTNILCFIFIISSLINSLGNPFMITIYATGKIKLLQIFSTILYLLDLAIIYICYKLGYPLYVGPLVKVFIDVSITLLRILLAKKYFSRFSLKLYLSKVILPIFLLMVFTLTYTYFFVEVFKPFIGKVTISLIVYALTLITIPLICLNKDERCFIFSLLTNLFKSKTRS